ncbi:MAG: extensin family protein [Rhodobacteraceae bacterium]|nr:extensin family protein [Paracoccaceae bacterium]
MRLHGLRFLALALIVAFPVAAQGPEVSLRPLARAASDAVETGRPQARAASDAPVPATGQRPMLRPVSAKTLAMTVPAPVPDTGPVVSPRPTLRPGALIEQVMAGRRARQAGSVCGDPDLQGETVGRVPGRIKGCGIAEAVRLKSVSGITLSQAALIDCPTARALKTVVDTGIKRAFRGAERVTRLRVAAHYSCRTRNNQRGARISEHGKGRAIDISAFYLANGKVVTVGGGWTSRGTRQALRRIHKTACGPFGTVLGPDSDRFHRDHFHFDTARYRSGP